MNTQTTKKPREYFVPEKQLGEAYKFIRNALSTLATGREDIDFSRMELCYEQIDRPWNLVASDVYSVRHANELENEIAQISKEEHDEAVADANDIASQIENLREQIRDAQHRLMAAKRKADKWAFPTGRLRQLQSDNPDLFADIEELSEGGRMATERPCKVAVLHEIRAALQR
ncbi:hypothetical protein ACYFX5_08895 [Bremerella sp. T1]|uniref:hypothetical protein n=1 Tax=Bremerella sp. TYQ1 TaxID=3119568 RepID=UPI001CCBF436|nr:hypothetical protein [Bremerella volcania]UBM38371.1 hypothetical protein LA756_10825 [Bremerella volcania]